MDTFDFSPVTKNLENLQNDVSSILSASSDIIYSPVRTSAILLKQLTSPLIDGVLHFGDDPSATVIQADKISAAPSNDTVSNDGDASQYLSFDQQSNGNDVWKANDAWKSSGVEQDNYVQQKNEGQQTSDGQRSSRIQFSNHLKHSHDVRQTPKGGTDDYFAGYDAEAD